MCTAIAMNHGDFYFGRNLDLDESFGERVVITPRQFQLRFRLEKSIDSHHAMIGMATVEDGYPLYAEAVNEMGLAMAGLNFPGNAVYAEKSDPQKNNIAPFELIPWMLSQAADLQEAERLLHSLCLVGIDFRHDLPLTPLHWMISDRSGSLVLEKTREGMKIFRNPVGVLTNNPPFGFHLAHLASFVNLCNYPIGNDFTKYASEAAGLGLGANGLPGDYSSTARFVKATWLLQCSSSIELKTEIERVSHFFHLLSAVAPIKGAVMTEKGKCHYTLYSCCANATKGIFYFKTYDAPQIRAVNMKEIKASDLNGVSLIVC